MAEPSASESSAATDSDQDFDPTAEMLVNDFDDEHTLDEEEAMDDNDINGEEEIDDLHKEGEMPLEDLLALYGYSEKVVSNSDKSVEKVEATSTTTTSETYSSSEAITNNTNNSNNSNNNNSNSSNNSNNNNNGLVNANANNIHNSNTSQLLGVVTNSNPHSHVTHLRSSQPFSHMNNQNMGSDSSDDESDDDFSVNEEDWRRTIQVGSDFQASIPEGLSRYDGAPAYENEDRLLWDPSHLEDKEIEEFLMRFSQNTEEETNGDAEAVVTSTLLPTGSHIRDDEQALYLLHQCGHNVEEALRRRRMTANLPAINESMTSWSEEECKAFEAGLRNYGKDFHLVQLNKVRTRSVGELVQFYYLWKKTERHDVFATKFRLEKKKYSLHPGTTDYMDRFLDEQENMALTVQTSLSSCSSLNNIQSSNKQMHSYRSSPSTQSLNSSPHKSDHILMDDLSTHYANLNSFCDSGGGSNSSHISGGNAFVNCYYKKSDSVLCSSVGSAGNSNNVIPAKVCHSSNPITNDWVASQQSVSTSNANGPDLNTDFIRRNPISSTLINDNNIHSMSASNNTSSKNI